MNDIFAHNDKKRQQQEQYNANAIEVLEGLEPVRKRPGMYIGGTDERAMHHLVAEIIDNAMDEAIAGYCDEIDVIFNEDGSVTISDNGRGIPIDPHPQYPDKSALEVILTILHSGGKFSQNAYQTSGGLHGVGLSVVNALSSHLEVEIIRERIRYRQTYSRGIATSSLSSEDVKGQRTGKKSGTAICFMPDLEIFKNAQDFHAKKLYQMAKDKAFLHAGVKIHWHCAEKFLDDNIPANQTLHYPNGMCDYIAELTQLEVHEDNCFFGKTEKNNQGEWVEWAILWNIDDEQSQPSLVNSFCNSIPTPDGGTHETALKSALARALRQYGDMVGEKKSSRITGDDISNDCIMLLSIFVIEPQFQGQTKQKLNMREAAKLVDTAICDRFEQWLALHNDYAQKLLNYVIEQVNQRLLKREEKRDKTKISQNRQPLPGKLADCTLHGEGSELFIVEGDSAGGSAKQARAREYQAVLPLRGKILNVASASEQRRGANQELKDLMLALGCGYGKDYDANALRYEKIIIMTDADVDGAHIATLLMTFFLQEMPDLITNGHLYLAKPPLFRISDGKKSFYAHDEEMLNDIKKREFKQNQKCDISRFKGLGEMRPQQLKETTMDRQTRQLIRVNIDNMDDSQDIINRLMGRQASQRFDFICAHINQMPQWHVELDI